MSTDAKRQGPRPPADASARLLGLLSLALGVPQIAAPGRVARLIGVRDDGAGRAWMRAVGVREIAAAAGILSHPRPVGWLWARVAGDAKDLLLLGAAFASKDAQPRRLAGTAAAVAGIAVADVLASVRMTRGATRLTAAITLSRPPEAVYAFWRDFQNLPRFMAHLQSVEASGNGRSHWSSKAPAGGMVEWDAEIVEDRPNELIAWRSLPGADVETSGSVRFAPAPGGRGTEIRLELEYTAPGGAAGRAVAKLLGEEPSQQVEDDLRRFKQVMETGEVVRSDGSPEGTLARRQAKQRPAHPVGAGADGSPS